AIRAPEIWIEIAAHVARNGGNVPLVLCDQNDKHRRNSRQRAPAECWSLKRGQSDPPRTLDSYDALRVQQAAYSSDRAADNHTGENRHHLKKSSEANGNQRGCQES